jgi:hypothetical protein
MRIKALAAENSPLPTDVPPGVAIAQLSQLCDRISGALPEAGEVAARSAGGPKIIKRQRGAAP